jgi:hypothetical protein
VIDTKPFSLQKVLIVKSYHNAGTAVTVIDKFTYDDKGRLLKVYQNNNAAATDQLVAQYECNELGQLVDKKLHNTTGTDFFQSVDLNSHQGRRVHVCVAQLRRRLQQLDVF